MHLSAGASGPCPCGFLFRPDLRPGLCYVLSNRQRIPNGQPAINETRYASGRRETLECRGSRLAPERHEAFIEGDSELLHQNPRTQRPGRVVLVRDEELEHCEVAVLTPNARVKGARV